jgi:hypothetical protein
MPAATYNPYNSSNVNNSFNTNTNTRTVFSRVLRDLSNWGMSYDNMVIKNRMAVGINEDPRAAISYGMYDFFSQRAIASIMSKKSISYLDKSYFDKRRILREYSLKDEIREFLTTITDETIIFDNDKNFCKPSVIPDSYEQNVKDKYQQVFEQIYTAFGFNDGISAWNFMKTFLIDGYLSFEMIYDDKQKNIIGFNQIDPTTIIPGYEPTSGKHIWIQYPEDPLLRRVLLDSQIIYISYSTHSDFSETSYVEGLIRPFNQLKILEQTRIMFNIVNASPYQKFTIPVQGISRQRAEEQVAQLIADYSEEVNWDDTLGTVSINGAKHLPLNKQLWFPEGESGKPEFELVSPQQENLNEAEILGWFYKNLKRASKIPFTRLDNESGGGAVYSSDSSDITRDEIKFSNFTSRLRTIFKEIITKPIKIQMLIEFPELRNDNKFLNKIGIEFNTNEEFQEWKRLANLAKKVEIASTLLSTFQVEEGKPYFHPSYLVDSVLKLTEEEKQANQAYFLKEPLTGLAGGSEAGGGAQTTQATPEAGGGEQEAPPETPESEAPAEGKEGFEF